MLDGRPEDVTSIAHAGPAGSRFSDISAERSGGRVARWSVMRKSLADMARSLGLMAVIVAAMLFIGARYLVMPGSADRMPPVDDSSVLQGFGDVAHVATLAPRQLPSSWRANAARLWAPRPGAEQMHVGWAIPGARFAGLDEATGDPRDVIAGVLGAAGAAVRSVTEIAGQQWQVRQSSRGEAAFTRQAGSVFVIVTGNATDAELRLLAGSLG